MTGTYYRSAIPCCPFTVFVDGPGVWLRILREQPPAEYRALLQAPQQEQQPA
ncbi:hypothetical protein [Streptomyces coeruleofuscus]|uniref:hypothetical protein n=1 Tax=Streptomyces coeruleofuscus TaxID=66879 RepID=UPI0031F878CA